MPFDELAAALTSRVVNAGTEIIHKPLDVPQANKAAEALIKGVYGAAFDYIVRGVNESIDHLNGEEDNNAGPSIGVLDIFGFETFQTNNFEQLCINYTNEALQQQFNKFVFKVEQKEYEKEGILWKFIAFPDNQDVLDLIDMKHTGVLALLDEQPGPPARVLHAAMAGQQLGADEALVREEAARVASREFGELRGQLRVLELVGHLSPLLGLLGTVLGMIEAFQALEASGTRADPALLSGGIWEALLTTAVGLIVAVPALVSLAWLEGMHERIMRRTEDVLTRLFTLPLARPAEVPARPARKLAAASA